MNDEGETREVDPQYLSIKEHTFKNHVGIYLMNNSQTLNLNVTLNFQLYNMLVEGHEESEITVHVPARSKDTFVMVKPANTLETGSCSYRISF